MLILLGTREAGMSALICGIHGLDRIMLSCARQPDFRSESCRRLTAVSAQKGEGALVREDPEFGRVACLVDVEWLPYARTWS